MKRYTIKTETYGPISFKDQFCVELENRDHLKEYVRNLNLHPDTKVEITEEDI